MDLNQKPTNNLSQSQLEIMRRVRVVAFVYRIMESPYMGGIGVLVLVYVAGMVVSLDHVKTNILAHSDWSSRFSYSLSSLEHTQIVVQAIAISIVVLGSFILFNSVRTIRRSGFTSLFLMRRAG